jgi:TetR/AcrR family transcriptional repressor of nem operon
MNAKREQKARSHASILASAARLLRERGISGARVADVMEGAGLTVGGFYAHFDSKETLIDQTLAETSRELRARLFSGLAQKPKGARALVALKRYLSAEHRDDPAHGCPFPAVVGEIASGQAHSHALTEQVEALARELGEHVPARPNLSRRQLALALVATMYGGLALARALRGSAISDEMLRACRALGALACPTDDAS